MKKLMPLLLIVILVTTGCVTPGKILVSLNEIQHTTASVYEEAKAETEKIAKECGRLAREKDVVPTFDTCKQLGVPLPYDPVKLNTLAPYINASFEAIRAAAPFVKGEVLTKEGSLKLEAAVESILHLCNLAKELGIGQPKSYTDAQKLHTDFQKVKVN